MDEENRADKEAIDSSTRAFEVQYPMRARLLFSTWIAMAVATTANVSSASPPAPSRSAAEPKFTTGPKAWTLATTAQLSYANGSCRDMLPPEVRADSNAASTRRLLHDWWGVDSRSDLLQTLDRLDGGGGHRTVFQEKGRVYAAMTEAQFQAALRAAAKQPENVRRMKLVRGYYAKHRDNSFLGWDYCRYIMLCRWGYQVGFLSQDEAWARMIPAARRIQSSFHSWAELGEDYLAGRELWSPQETARTGKYYREVGAWLVKEPGGPWTRLPWSMDLGVAASR